MLLRVSPFTTLFFIMHFALTSLSLLFLCLCSNANAQWNAMGNSPPRSQVSTVFNDSTTTTSFWLEGVVHQGVAAFRKNSTYQVFRNVKDFGAKGLHLWLLDLVKHLLIDLKGMASATTL